jgi:hypothetical protein
VDLQPAFDTASVLNKAQFPEPVPLKNHPRRCGSDHISQSFLTHLWNQRTFAKEVSFFQHTDGRFSAGLGYDGELHFAGLNIEDRIRSVFLCEDRLLLGNSHVLPAIADGCKEGGGVEVTLLLIRYCRKLISSNSGTRASLIGINRD